MYYNSNKNSHDYYNSYKKEIEELEAYRKEEHTQKIMKIILSLLTLMLLIVGAFYLYLYFNPSFNRLNISSTKPIENILIREEELSQNIQCPEANISTAKSKINEKDIELIVKIIMSKMNKKVEKIVEEQPNEIKNDSPIQLNSSLNSSVKEKPETHKDEMSIIIIVKEEDTLSKIAEKVYGNPDDYKKILDANPEIQNNPNKIFVGQHLRIPS